MNTDGTIPAFRIIYLQRLADPTQVWAAETSANPNPYRTVDAMTVDLTCFNGVTSAKDPTTTTGKFNFEAHQRGEKNYLPSTPTEMNLWKQEPALKGAPSPMAGWTPQAGPAVAPLRKEPTTSANRSMRAWGI